MIRWGAALVLVLVLGAANAAHAAPRAPVVVLVTPTTNEEQSTWSEAERRVAAELSLAGFQVVRVAEPSAPPDSVDLEGLASERDAVAALKIGRGDGEECVRVWIGDAVTDKTVTRRIGAAELDSPDAAATLALRVVELLRATLLEVRVPGRAGAPQQEVPAEVDRLVTGPSPPAPRWELWLGPHAAAAFSSLGGLGGVAVGGLWRWSQLDLELDVAATVTVPEVEVRFAGQPVGDLGRPLVDATLALAWTGPQ